MPKKHQLCNFNFEKLLCNQFSKFSKLKFLESPWILGIFYAAVQSGYFFDVITITIKHGFSKNLSVKNFSASKNSVKTSRKSSTYMKLGLIALTQFAQAGTWKE